MGVRGYLRENDFHGKYGQMLEMTLESCDCTKSNHYIHHLAFYVDDLFGWFTLQPFLYHFIL